MLLTSEKTKSEAERKVGAAKKQDRVSNLEVVNSYVNAINNFQRLLESDINEMEKALSKSEATLSEYAIQRIEHWLKKAKDDYSGTLQNMKKAFQFIK